MMPAKSAFAACLIAGVVDLLAIDLHLGPRALAPVDIHASAPSEATRPGAVASVPTPLPEPPPPPPPVPAATVEAVAGETEPEIEIVARFEQEQSEADLESLRKLAVRLREDESAEIVLEGHSDASGNEYRNLSLSLDRAHWVRDHLGELGISKSRMKAVGLGSARPLVASDPQSPANRRVEARWVRRTSKDGG